jgi:hypothetical protein
MSDSDNISVLHPIQLLDRALSEESHAEDIKPRTHEKIKADHPRLSVIFPAN